MNVIFVGISNKSNSNGEMLPLDILTPSGLIISKVDQKLGFKTSKINLVSHTPLDNNGKIRYPNKEEIDNGVKELKKYFDSHSPCIVFMLGKIVQKAITQNIMPNNNILLLAIKHPSYIYIYKRSTIDEYVDDIVQIVNKHLI